MGADVAAVRASTLAGETPRAAPLEALTQRASLNAIAGLLDYAAKAIVVVAITPVLVSGLGRTLYGVWEMLFRLGGSMNAVDGRPTDALRLVVAQHQTSDDDTAKRRFVGAALLVYAVLLPVLAIVGGIVAWTVAPALTKAPPELTGVVRVATALVLAAFLVVGLASVPEAVLRGMNLGYRRMGVQAALNALNGVLAAGAVWLGFGLAGVAMAQLVFAVASGLCFWWLTRRFVAWLGVARPRREDVRMLFGLGAWLTVGEAIAKVLFAMDVLILGAVVAPALVTTYVLTGYAARMAQGMHIFAAGAAIPGLGGLLGRGEQARAQAARRDLLLLTWLFATVSGAVMLCLNRTFVTLWVGEANYAGLVVDVLLVLLTVQTVYIRVDAYIIDAALAPRLRVLISGAAVVASLGLAIWLTRAYGIVGLCTGLLAGRALQSVTYPLLARRHVGAPNARPLATGRRVAVMLALFVVAAWLGQGVEVEGWLACVALAITATVVTTVLAFVLGPDARERRILRLRLGALHPTWRRA